MAMQIQSAIRQSSFSLLTLGLLSSAWAQDQRCFKNVKVKVPDAELVQLISLPKLGNSHISDITELKDGTVVVPQISQDGLGGVLTFVNPNKGYEKKTVTFPGKPDVFQIRALNDGKLFVTTFETIQDDNGDTLKGESKGYVMRPDGSFSAIFYLDRYPNQIFESPKGELLVSHGDGHELVPQISAYDHTGKLLRKVNPPSDIGDEPLGQAKDGTLYVLGRNEEGQRSTLVLLNPDGSLRKRLSQSPWYGSPVSQSDGTIAMVTGPYDQARVQRLSTSGEVKESYPIRAAAHYDASFVRPGGFDVLNDDRVLLMAGSGFGIATREGDMSTFIHTEDRWLPQVLRDGKLLVRSPMREGDWMIRNSDGGEYLRFKSSSKLLLRESPTSSVQTKDGKLWAAGFQGKGSLRETYHLEVRKIVEAAKEVTKRVQVDCGTGEVISESNAPASH